MTNQNTRSHLIIIAVSHPASIVAYRVDLASVEVAAAINLLSGIATLGHIACFAIVPTPDPIYMVNSVEALRSVFGHLVVDAVLAADAGSDEPPPAYLMPVWAFDHELAGMPASTARLLNLDLELVATPSDHEEVGICLPGRDGLWLVHARPVAS